MFSAKYTVPQSDAEPFWLYARLDPKSHQAPVPVDDTIELSEEEFEERSNQNVERWVSLHIIPVRRICFHPRKLDSYGPISRNLISCFHLARIRLL